MLETLNDIGLSLRPCVKTDEQHKPDIEISFTFPSTTHLKEAFLHLFRYMQCGQCLTVYRTASEPSSIVERFSWTFCS